MFPASTEAIIRPKGSVLQGIFFISKEDHMDSYTAEVQHVSDETKIVCACENCQWTGMASDLKPIDDCILTPGDASPAGRCPECETLAYVVNEGDTSPQLHKRFALGAYLVSMDVDQDGHLSVYVKSTDGSKAIDVAADIGAEDEVCLRATTSLIEQQHEEAELAERRAKMPKWDYSADSKLQILEDFGYRLTHEEGEFTISFVENPAYYTVYSSSRLEVIRAGYAKLMAEVAEVDPLAAYRFPDFTDSPASMKNKPALPFVMQSSITCINETTQFYQAVQWRAELESQYNQYFGNTEWDWNDVHEVDRDAIIELEEVIRSYAKPPMDMEVVTSFRSESWRNIQRFKSVS